MVRLALVLAFAATGCAATIQQRPSSSRACSPSKLWIADAVLTAAIAGVAIYGANEGSERGLTVAGVGLIAGGTTLASMVTGLKWNGQCRRGEAPTIAAR